MSVRNYFKDIILGYGAGEAGVQSCWMTALQSYLGGEWTDKCPCVDPSINQACIHANDMYGQHHAERTKDILEFGITTPLNTYREDLLEERARKLADFYSMNGFYSVNGHGNNKTFAKEKMLPMIRELIDMGKAEPVKQKLNTFEKFKLLVGIKPKPKAQVTCSLGRGARGELSNHQH